MVQLFQRQMKDAGRQSSKGNQLKWQDGDIWYKADYTGYEGLSEYVISHLLEMSTLRKEEYILYDLEEIRYGRQTFLGCRSLDFLEAGRQLITLERLFQSFQGKGLHKCIYEINDHEERVRFLVEQTERITGLQDFGGYLAKLIAIDAFFLNEDRHTHNIAVLMNAEGQYGYCPIFDNGAGLLSDTAMDYPLGADIYESIEKVKACTFCDDFTEQLDIVERLYGNRLRFSFGRKDVERLLASAVAYPPEIRERVRDILFEQMRKYAYLFA
ncbi:MAG: hypothetical protein NC337_02205 [Roseburia sp.]|nr:hypothetical protein [Roseburia sp.]